MDNTPKTIPFDTLQFMPRFEYGDQGQLAEISGAHQGTVLGTGFARLTNAYIPWTIKYDEVLLVIEGSVTIETNDDELIANAKDSIWLPKGTNLVYRAENALVFYAIHPANWAEL